MNRSFTDKDLGLVEIRRNPQARRYILRLKPDRILLTVPIGVSYDSALAFLHEKRDWVLTHKDTVQCPPRIINAENPLQTLTFSVHIQPSPRRNILFSLQNAVLNVLYPQPEMPESDKMQRKFRQGIEAALRFEAKRILPEKLQRFSREHHLPFSGVKIQQSKTHWGSCSSRKSINLSYFLLLLPEHLVDYVLLHELSHTVEMNHSPRFWALLDKLTGGKAKTLAKEIKQYRTGF